MIKQKNILNWIKKLFNRDCKHSSVNQFEKADFCPDCGNKIKLSWIVTRCQECRAVRMSKTDKHGNISPLQKFCTHCGSEKWFSEKSDKTGLSNSLYAVCIKEIVQEDDDISEEFKKSDLNYTNVWVEGDNKLAFKPKRNIIKARKG